MAHKYILDTHALIWFLEGNKRLSQPAKSIMSGLDNELVLPLIALAEAVIIIERRRTTIPDVSQFLTKVYADPRIEIYPLTLEIFERSLTLEGMSIPELHDRFIVSTGLYL
ncbi:MAG TPA: PIN domain-containing protein [Anaerolineae bacterium]|jgi:PIN domain nuclease of toxin-antitoxin system